MRLTSRLAAGLALAAVAAVPASASAVENGPAPTVTSLRGIAGPYSLSRQVYADSATPGFGAGTVFAPSNGAPGQTFGVVAFAPGFTETSSSVSWLAQRVASYGFVTIAFNVNSTFTDLPAQRGTQLLAALDFVRKSSAQKSLADGTRLAVSGHSMGGGGTLDASKARPSLKAAVGLEPWNTSTNWSSITVPSLELGAQSDIIAPVASHAIPFYKSIPATTPKSYVEFAGQDHFYSNSPRAAVGAATIAWLKRYVDDDQRYTQFLTPTQPALGANEVSSFAVNAVN